MAVVLYNCKRCKVGKRVEYRAGRERSGNQSWPYRLTVLGRRIFPGREDGCCSQCQRPMAWDYLQAVNNPEVRCDARCTNARGFKCECSCGGENHGAGWGVYRETAAA